jgi:hypothetical protein
MLGHGSVSCVRERERERVVWSYRTLTDGKQELDLVSEPSVRCGSSEDGKGEEGEEGGPASVSIARRS